MKKWLLISLVISVLLLSLIIFESFYGFTGKVISNEAVPNFGPSSEDVDCMMTCMKCTSPGVGCTGNQQECQTKCNVKKPEVTEETSCMETCVVKECGEYDFICQAKNQDTCENECGMIKEPPAKNEEEQCIRDCVNLHSKGTRCKPSQEGEQGNDVCKMCAQQCVHLYVGPCLGEEKLESKKKECETCEHCYGKPVMGDSGEGWECIVDVECNDASGEFGDEPGSGPGIIGAVGGAVQSVGEAIGNAVEAVANFVQDLF